MYWENRTSHPLATELTATFRSVKSVRVVSTTTGVPILSVLQPHSGLRLSNFRRDPITYRRSSCHTNQTDSIYKPSSNTLSTVPNTSRAAGPARGGGVWRHQPRLGTKALHHTRRQTLHAHQTHTLAGDPPDIQSQKERRPTAP